MTYTEREIWTKGRRGCATCIQVAIYPHSIVATTDGEHITPAQLCKALNREFPRHVFYINNRLGNRHYLRANADRFTNDGIEK